MEDEKKAIDELLFIKKVITDSQKIVVDNGMGYIIWGVITALGMIGGYIKFKLDLPFNYVWIWTVLIPMGWLFSYFYYYKKRPNKVDTFAGRILGNLWFSFGVCLSIVGFGGYFSGAIRGENIASIMAVIMGGAFYLSSTIYGSGWYKLLGVTWWLGGILLFFVVNENQFLIFAGLMIFCQILPGIISYRKYKAQK